MHQAGGCVTPPAPTVPGPELLAQVTVAIADRIDDARRAGVMFLIQRCALGLGPEHRARLALLLDELCDLLPKEAAR